MRIFIVDDHVLFREGLASIFESQPDFTVVGQAGCVQEALENIAEVRPDLVLIDLNLPDGDGLMLVSSISSRYPEIEIVILTIFDSDELLFESIRAGAKGFIVKNTPRAELLSSLRAIKRGEAALSRRLTRRLMNEVNRISKIQSSMDPGYVDVLTERELDVLRELGNGSSTQEIAEHLCITDNTVKSHVHKILSKLNLQSRNEAKKYAHRIGLTHRYQDDEKGERASL